MPRCARTGGHSDWLKPHSPAHAQLRASARAMSGIDAPWGILLLHTLRNAIERAASEERVEQRQLHAQARAVAALRKVERAVAIADASQAEAMSTIRAHRQAARHAAELERRRTRLASAPRH